MTDRSFTVDLLMPPSLWRLYRGHGKQRGKAAAYRRWCQDAGWRVLNRRGNFKGVAGPVRVSLELLRSGRLSDLDNRFKGPLDVLTATQTIVDDSQVVALDACWVDAGPACRMTVRAREGGL